MSLAYRSSPFQARERRYDAMAAQPTQTKSSMLTLSSRLETKVFESDWFAPSRCEIRSTSSLDGAQRRKHYQFANILSAPARMVVDLAASCVAAPAGIFWHSGKAIASSGDLRAEHKECAVKELFKTIMLVSVVALPFLFSLDAEEALVKLLVTIPIWCLFFTAMKMGTALICPAKIGWGPNPFVGDDEKWCAKMGIKWELGIDIDYRTEKTLKALIEESLNRVLLSIVELQKKLPSGHRLPCSGKLDVHEALLYLERSRAELTQHGIWDNIKQDRDNLEKYGTLLHRLKQYTKKTWGEPTQKGLEYAYTCRDTLPLIKSRPSPDPKIYSLTQILFQRMLSSDWLFPSNYVSRAVEDKGSIEESLREFDPYKNRHPITSYSHTALKPVRYAGRFVAMALICGGGAPIGMLYNSCQALRYTLSAACQKEEEKFGNWVKVHAYALAALNDFTALVGIFWLLPIMNGGEYLAPLAFRDTRSGLFKTITLKNQFGITGPTGHLLSFNTRRDTSAYLEPDTFFNNLFDKRSISLWYGLNSVYPAIANKDEFSRLLSNFTHSGKFSPLLKFLEQQPIPQNKVKECQQIFEDLKELRLIIQDALSATERGMFDKMEYSVNLPFHTRPLNFTEEASPTVIHNQVIENAKKTIQQIKAEEGPSDEWKQFKAGLFAEGATPASILQLDDLTKKGIEAAYKKFSMHFHPDKLFHLSEPLKKEGVELFKLLSNLRDMLLKELE